LTKLSQKEGNKMNYPEYAVIDTTDNSGLHVEEWDDEKHQDTGNVVRVIPYSLLCLCAGYISACPEFQHCHPEDVLDWIKKEMPDDHKVKQFKGGKG
jgi:hypothetical protein